MLLLSWINLLLIFLLNIQTAAARSNIDLESAQEFVVLSTPYPMTDDPEEPPEHGRTTKIFRKKKPTPYAFMDYFTLNKTEKWPHDTVYYKFEHQFSPRYKQHLQECFNILQNKTCIRFESFEQVMTRNPAIVSENIKPLKIYCLLERRCIVSIGYNRSGDNEMHLNEKFCKDRKSILHLLIHVLGFDHENVRPDAGLYSTLLYSPDRHFEMAFNSSLHHNSYTYMPYNWRSIMHITPPVPLLMPKREGRQLRFGKRSLKPQGYQMQIYGPRFSDWFPNDLGQLDLNNLNRHYHCGEHSPLCRDHFGLENCTRYGLGASTLGGHSLNVANHAQCSNDYFARHQCPKTCGTCVHFYKQDVQQ